MYTLTLSELKINPPLIEDKKFENEDRWALQDEAVAYITSTYNDTYKNPVTVERLVKKAVRDADGKTDDDRFNEEDKKFNQELTADRAERQAKADVISAEYAPKNEDLKTWLNTEHEKIISEYDDKIFAANPEDKEALREEQQLKIDDLKFEHRKKSDALWNEQLIKEQEVWHAE
jgi:hypothetical protein